MEAIKAKVKEMEEEQKKLQEMQGEMDKELQSPVQSGSKTPGGSGNNFLSPEEKQEIDSRSVYVGNVCKNVITFILVSRIYIRTSYHQSIRHTQFFSDIYRKEL